MNPRGRILGATALALAALSGACGHGADVCELEFRIESDDSSGPVEVGGAVVAVHDRLKPLAGRRGLETTSRGYEAILVRLGFDPNETELAEIRARVERRGALEFLPVVSDDSSEFQMADERARLDAWRAQHPDRSLSDFNGLARDQGGPSQGLIWMPMREQGAGPLACDARVRSDRERCFTEADLGRIGAVPDESGYPAVRFAISEKRRAAFGDFTEALRSRQLAIVVDGVVVTAPFVEQALRGESRISGRFTQAECNALVDVLRSTGVAGRLPFDLVYAAKRPLEKR